MKRLTLISYVMVETGKIVQHDTWGPYSGRYDAYAQCKAHALEHHHEDGLSFTELDSCHERYETGVNRYGQRRSYLVRELVIV